MALFTKKAVKNLLAAGTVKPEQVTDLTYEDKVVVLQKQRGHGAKKKSKAYSKTHITESKKIETCTMWAATGSVEKTAALCKVPRATIERWKDEEWWLVMSQRIKREENEALDRAFSDVVTASVTKLKERIEKGDQMYDIKKGVLVDVPVTARDLAIVSGTVFDKRQLLRGEATKISKAVNLEEHLDKLANKFAEAVKASKGRLPATIDMEDAEVVDKAEQQVLPEPVGETS